MDLCYFSRYDSSRNEHRDRRNSYRNDDSKWPSRDTGGHHQQNRSYQNYNEPKTTLVIKGVPQGMPADTVRIWPYQSDMKCIL